MVGGAIFPKRPNSPPACYPKHERPALPATDHPHQILSSLWVVSSVPGEPPCRPVRAIVAFCSECAVRSNTMAPRPPHALGLLARLKATALTEIPVARRDVPVGLSQVALSWSIAGQSNFKEKRLADLIGKRSNSVVPI